MSSLIVRAFFLLFIRSRSSVVTRIEAEPHNYPNVGYLLSPLVTIPVMQRTGATTDGRSCGRLHPSRRGARSVVKPDMARVRGRLVPL